MRAEKQFITKEYLARLNASPFFLVVDYRGLSVGQFTELRKRLAKASAEIHVVKNSIFRAAAREAGIGDLSGSLEGQLAVVTGQRDVSAAAKAVKVFQSEFERPKLRFGYVDDKRLEEKAVLQLADLPSIEVLRSTLLATLMSPAQNLARQQNTPATQLAQVLRAWADEREKASEG
jgi:large subunit ribosomal protein L10